MSERPDVAAIRAKAFESAVNAAYHRGRRDADVEIARLRGVVESFAKEMDAGAEEWRRVYADVERADACLESARRIRALLPTTEGRGTEGLEESLTEKERVDMMHLLGAFASRGKR